MYMFLVVFFLTFEDDIVTEDDHQQNQYSIKQSQKNKTISFETDAYSNHKIVEYKGRSNNTIV